jgi:hypothetical protein
MTHPHCHSRTSIHTDHTDSVVAKPTITLQRTLPCLDQLRNYTCEALPVIRSEELSLSGRKASGCVCRLFQVAVCEYISNFVPVL